MSRRGCGDANGKRLMQTCCPAVITTVRIMYHARTSFWKEAYWVLETKTNTEIGTATRGRRPYSTLIYNYNYLQLWNMVSSYSSTTTEATDYRLRFSLTDAHHLAPPKNATCTRPSAQHAS